MLFCVMSFVAASSPNHFYFSSFLFQPYSTTLSKLHNFRFSTIPLSLSLDYQTAAMEKEAQGKTHMNKALLVLNCFILSIGNCGGPLIMRLYFLHGGKRVWLSSWLETGGWPIIFIPLLISYFHRRRLANIAGVDGSGSGTPVQIFFMKPRLFFASAFIGLITGLDDYFYAYGVARLPVSTSALLIASQLAFTAGFAFLMVKQKFTAYSINAVVLLTMGGAVLAMHTSGDRPAGESSRQYILGFVMTLAAAVLYGFILPLVELTYKKAKQTITYTLVLEIQLVMCIFATIFCTFGMLVNNDFKVIPREAREFDLGETKYYVILVWSAIVWQGFFLGAIGIIFCASSLVSGIVIAVLLPVTEILAVICFKESFKAEKGLSLALSLWGFVSYFYGDIKNNLREKKRQNQSLEAEIAQNSQIPYSSV